MRAATGLLAACLVIAPAVLFGLVSASAPTAAQEAAPMRIGLVEAPAAGVLFVASGPDGAPAGVTKDLATGMAQALGHTAAFSVFPNTGAATEALQAGTIDVSFMPVDDARRRVIDFGPGYYALESTYLVGGVTGITDTAGVDRAGLRVIGITGSTTFRAAARTLTHTQPVAVPSVAQAAAMMRDGQADALALSRDALPAVMAQVPGSVITTGSFQKTMVAVAVPKDRPEDLRRVSEWLTQAKASGLVRRVFDAHGLQSEAVAD